MKIGAVHKGLSLDHYEEHFPGEPRSEIRTAKCCGSCNFGENDYEGVVNCKFGSSHQQMYVCGKHEWKPGSFEEIVFESGENTDPSDYSHLFYLEESIMVRNQKIVFRVDHVAGQGMHEYLTPEELKTVVSFTIVFLSGFYDEIDGIVKTFRKNL